MNRISISIKILLVVSFVVIFTEIITRFFWHTTAKGIYDIEQISPESCHNVDSNLGFKLKEGHYTYLYKSGFSFSATHAFQGTRICGNEKNASYPRILIFGD